MKIMKFLRFLFFGIVLLFFIVWGILVAFLQTDMGQRYLLEKATTAIESSTGAKITIEEITFSFPIKLHLKNVRASKNEKLLFLIESADIACSSARLAHGKLVFQSIHLTTLSLYDLPVSNESGEGFFLPVKIKQLNIDKLQLEDSLVDALDISNETKSLLKRSFISITGQIKTNPLEGSLSSHLIDSTGEFPPLKIDLGFLNNEIWVNGFLSPIHLNGFDAAVTVHATTTFFDWKNLKGLAKGMVLPSTNHSLPLYLSTETMIEGQFSIDSLGFLEFQKFFITSPYLNLTGSGTIDQNRKIHKGTFEGEIKALQELNPKWNDYIKEPIRLKGTVNGPLLNPSVAFGAFHGNDSAILKADWTQNKTLDLTILNTMIFGLNLKGFLKISPTQKTIEGSLNGSSEDFSKLPFQKGKIKGSSTFKSQFYSTPDSLQTVKIAINGTDTTVHQLSSKTYEATIDLTVLDYSWDQIVVKSTLKGKKIEWENTILEHFECLSEFHLNNHSQQITDFSLFSKGKSLHFSQGLLSGFQGEAHLTRAWPIPEGTIEFEASDTKIGPLEFKEFKGKTDVSKDGVKSPFEVIAEGKENGSFKLQGSGTWNKLNGLWKLTWEKLDGELGQYPLTLNSPAQFIYSNGTFTGSELSLQWGEGGFYGNFLKKGNILQTDFKTNNLSLQFFEEIIPHFPLNGKTVLQGHLEGPMDHLLGKMEIILKEVKIDEPFLLQQPLIHGNIALELIQEGIKVDSTIEGFGPRPFYANGTLPLKIDLSKLSITPLSDQHIHFNLTGEGDIDPYLDLFTSDLAGLDGYVTVAFKAEGKWDKPKIRGSLDFTKGVFESVNTGAIFRKIEAHLEGDGSAIQLTHFSAEDDKQGKITATGKITVERENDFPFQFSIRPQNIHLIDSDYAALSASGELELTGTTKKGLLKGKLLVDTAIVHLEEALPNQIKQVDVTYINTISDEHHAVHLEAVKKSSWLELSIDLQLPNDASIEGKNLSTTWEGTVTISGTPSEALFDGDLEIVKGEYNMNGKKFNLAQGTLHFAGPIGKKTTLYVVASKEIDNILAEIILKGPVTKLAVSFRSNPPLSQREILSYILFGRGISDITTNQGTQLSQSFVDLQNNSQASSSGDFLSRLRNNVGIDRLDFGSSNDNDYSLQIGKNITENITFSVNKSIIDAMYHYSIEAKLRKNLKAEAEVGVGDGYLLRSSIKWKKDY